MRLPCIDCCATGKCACGDCKGETCALCGGSGYAPLLTVQDIATEMQRLRQRALDAEKRADEWQGMWNVCHDRDVSKDAEIAALKAEIANVRKCLLPDSDAGWPIVAVAESVYAERAEGAAMLTAKDAEIAQLRGAIAAQDERNLQACQRIGLPPFDCDTPEHLADEVLKLREAIARLPEVTHAGDCTTHVTSLRREYGCDCRADTANAARAEARKAAGLE